MKLNKQLENIENNKIEKQKNFHRNKTMSIDEAKLTLSNKKKKNY